MNRRDAETQRKVKNERVNDRRLFSSSPLLPFFLSLCLCVSAVNLSCKSKPTDLRALVPADTLVYLETNDLASTLQPVVESKSVLQIGRAHV